MSDQSEAWRKANPARFNAFRKKSRMQSREEKLIFVWGYKLEHPCVDCGEDDPRVLDFDHRDPKTKRKGVAYMVQAGYSLEAAKAEVAKCDIRCANCHRRRSFDEDHCRVRRDVAA